MSITASYTMLSRPTMGHHHNVENASIG